jgi:Zn-dependent M28 family amino/carboxypeptidase
VVVSAHIDHLGVASAREAEGTDRVFNGADDGGSGATALLEIAEHIASLPERPRRSVLLLWTTGEEHGSVGARWFLERPTVRADRIIANINLDMIGRGNPGGGAGDGPARAHAVGSRRLSTEFGSWMREANARLEEPLDIDDRFDDDGSRAQYLCVGDHAAFFRAGIPSAFITTGTHGDYHRVSDDVERIDYALLARVARFVAAAVIDVANRPARPRLDGKKAQATEDCPG